MAFFTVLGFISRILQYSRNTPIHTKKKLWHEDAQQGETRVSLPTNQMLDKVNTIIIIIFQSLTA